MTQAVRRCFVHIGAPKTGSTYLQRLFFDNRAALRSEGLLYPDVSLRGYGHHDIAFLLAGGYPEWATPQSRTLAELGADLRRELSQAGELDVLLSSEDFYLCPAPERLRAFLEETGALAGRTPVIVAYVRRQDLAHESWYNQTIKAQGYSHDLRECVRASHDLWDYETQLARWGSVFGRDALVVRVYENGQLSGGSLERDMFEVLGRPAPASSGSEPINTGLNRDLLELQRLINCLPLSVVKKRRFHRQLIALSAKASGSGMFDERPLIDAELAATILASYDKGNSAVARTYLQRSTLFYDAPDPKRDSSSEGGGLTVEKLVYAIGWLLTADEPDRGHDDAT